MRKSQRHNRYAVDSTRLKSLNGLGINMVSRAGLEPGCASLDLQVTDSAFTSITQNTSSSLTALHGCYTEPRPESLNFPGQVQA